MKPLAAIADEYENDGLDECRPHWVTTGTAVFKLDQELYCGRGGKTLITLADASRARKALTGKAVTAPQMDKLMAKAKKLYEAMAHAGAPSWDGMSEEYREGILKRVRELDL